MFEVAAAYVGIAIGKKLLDHVGDDIGNAFDAALAKLGNWVTKRLRGRPVGDLALTQMTANPEGADPQKILAAALAEVASGDPAAAGQLTALLAELEKVKPAGLIVTSSIELDKLAAGKVTGISLKSDAPPKAQLTSNAKVETMTGGDLTGVELDFRSNQ